MSLRLCRRDAWRALLYLFSALIFLALVSPLVANWADLDRGVSWIFVAVGLVAVAVAGNYAWVLPKRRWSSPHSARFVGSQVTELGSDLLSSLELMKTPHSGSDALKQALFDDTARRITPLQVPAIVPYSTLGRAIKSVAAACGLYLAFALLAPNALAMGWNRLLKPKAHEPFDGANLKAKPLVGDLDVLVHFPEYTRIADLNLPASSGDFEVMPGSRISLTTRPTASSSNVRILLSQTDTLSSDEAIDLDLQGEIASGQFSVRSETFYRFETQSDGTRNVEARARHIGIRTDKAPTVEFYAPGDALDIAKLKRIELAFDASDDFGIAKVELVYKEVGGKEKRQPLEIPRAEDTPKSAQSNYIWDLSELSLRPGAEVHYHVEVTDNDDVLGPNISKSRSYSLRLFSPRERHEELMTRQKEIAENLLELLATRLTSQGAGLEEHQSIHRLASEIVVQLGGLVASLKSDELAQEKLSQTFEQLRDRMSKRIATEENLLAELSRTRGKPPEHFSKRMTDSDTHMIAQLEQDVLDVSDWLRRQEIENLLSISDEVKSSQERLAKLFEEYKRTGSEEILSEINRELRALEKRLEQMAMQSQSMPEDVLDRFVNSEALKQEHQADCLSKVKTLLAAGDIEEAQAQMVKCNEELDQSANALEDSLRELRGDSFSEEEKQFQETMDALADLTQDQEDIADKTDEVYKRYAETVAKMMQEQGAETQKKAGETLEKLQKKLREIPRRGLSPFAREELDILNNRLSDASAMLKRGELAEALSMARYVLRSLRTIASELKFTLEEDWSRMAVVAEKHAREALPLAKKLVEELNEATPAPSEIMSREDKRTLEKLKRQQKAVRSRTQKLQKQAKEQAEKLPGEAGKAIDEGLEQAGKNMRQAEKQMRSRDPSSARQEARSAAKRLQQAKEAAQGAARKKQKQGRASLRNEPIRIPGAEDYKAPEEFREEILDAMKQKDAPAGFVEQVDRYYKEIVQ